MKIVLLILISFNVLNGTMVPNLQIDVTCSKSTGKEFHLILFSDELYITDDALQETIGGYVDIPATKYYLRAHKQSLQLDGVVEYSHQSDLKKFSSYVDEIFIEKLHNIKSLQLIQKIQLKDNSNELVSITVFIDQTLLEKSKKICENQIKETHNDTYNKNMSMFLALLILLMLVVRSYKKNKSKL